jgi:AraC-like DNA-binding protein
VRNVFEFVQPHSALREYVRLFHVFRLDMPGNIDTAPAKSVWPSRYCWVSFSPLDNSRIESRLTGAVTAEARTAVIGHSTRVEKKRYAGPHWFRFQVQLQPGALYRLTGIPQLELTNTAIDAEAMMPVGTRRVNERLAEARSIEDMTAAVESYLIAWIARCTRRLRPIDRALDRMARDPSFRLDSAASLACLSTKQFYRSFVERMGVSPRTYLRIVRLTRVFNHKETQAHLTWLEIAQASGYYDYQHMAREFRLLTGQLPGDAFASERRSPERRFDFSFERGW